jgi:hypothetical protein
MRENSFLMADLVPLNCGYKRILRKFRGLVPLLQGQVLYLMKPQKVRNVNKQGIQLWLEKLASCVLAFGYSKLAHKAIKLLLLINVSNRNRIQNFLGLFHQEIQRFSSMPSLWHESPEIKDNTNTSSIAKEGVRFMRFAV